ncbi:YwbE family protein [Chloroflexota bacterium]
MNGTKRANLRPGMKVNIVLKKDQRRGLHTGGEAFTYGVVKDILTKSATHPHGIKVRLESGAVGRVKEILEN